MKSISVKIAKWMVFILCMMFVAGCGNQSVDNSVQSGTSAVESGTSSQATSSGATDASGESQSADIDALFHANSGADSTPAWAGAQYYQGEAISLWRKRNGSEDFQKALDIYVYDSKSNGKLVVSGAPSDYTGTWFLAKEGYCLAVIGNKLARIEADGSETFLVPVEAGVRDICQLEDGRIVIIVKEQSNSAKLAVLNPENGEYTKVEALDLGKDNRVYITAGEKGLLLLNSKGFWNVNLESGELTEEMPMSEYDFTLSYIVKDFRLAGGASVEFLFEGSTEVCLPKDIEKYREVITIQTRFVDGWLQALLDNFNKSNYKYYARMETDVMELERSYNAAAIADYKAQVEDEFATGAGADLIDINSMSSSFFENGYLEDLTPYMEKYGVDPLDYFPVTFEYGKEGDSLYVANLQMQMSGLKIKEEVLGSRQVPDVETLMDALLNYPTPAVLEKDWRSETVLHYLLAGSEDLWGLIDWEAGTCDFQSDFFAKALEVSKLFGNDAGLDLPALAEIYNSGTFYEHENSDQLKLSNEVYIGFLFDSGSHPWMLTGVGLAMNTNSTNKEGAWAVLQYLLSEEAQTQEILAYESGERFQRRFCPVNVLAYENIVLLETEETSLYRYIVNGDERTLYKAGFEEFKELNRDENAYRARYDLTELDADEIREMLYEASYMPGKPAEILDIIYEEAAKYFVDEQSLGDTYDAIQARAQAYLDQQFSHAQ